MRSSSRRSSSAFRTSGRTPQARVATLLAELKESLFFDPPQSAAELAALPAEDARTRPSAASCAQSIESKKAAEIGEEVLNRFIQFEYLRNIDSRWQDHLENLESLREAVYLRAYSQKNPLLEYKLEGFQIFDDMLYDIKTAHRPQDLPRPHPAGAEKPAAAARPWRRVQASHSAMGQFAAGASSGTTAV